MEEIAYRIKGDIKPDKDIIEVKQRDLGEILEVEETGAKITLRDAKSFLD